MQAPSPIFIRFKSSSTSKRPLHLYTDASQDGYGAILTSASSKVLRTFFCSRAYAKQHGCRGVYPPPDADIEGHEVYVQLLSYDRFGKALKGATLISLTDSIPAGCIVNQVIVRTKLGLEGGGAQQGGATDVKEGKAVLGAGRAVKGISEGAQKRAWAKHEPMCTTLQQIFEELQLRLQVAWKSRKENKDADLVSRAGSKEVRKRLSKELKDHLELLM